MIWEWCGSGRSQGLLYWQSCTLKRLPNCSLRKKGKVVGWHIWEGGLRHVHSSPEIKTQLQMPNGAITGGEDQLAQPFQIVQSAGRDIISISSIPKPHLEGAGKQKMQTVDQNSCKSSGSACGWVLHFLVICKSCGEILWENITYKLLITIFLLGGAAAVAFCAWHSSLAEPSWEDDLGLPALPAAVVHLPCVTSHLGFSGLGTGALSVPVNTSQKRLCWDFGCPLAIALICLVFMPKHPSSRASGWRGKKLNNRCFLLSEALLCYKMLRR